MSKQTGKKPPVDERDPADRQGAVPSAEEIRRRAHEIFFARGEAPGDELQDWLQAERELRERGEDVGS